MPKIERFEDLRCWQEARVLTREGYCLVEDGALSRDFRLRDQGYAAAETVAKLQEQSETCQPMTLGLLKHVRRTVDGKGQAASEPAVTYNGHSSGWALSASLIAKRKPSPG